MGAFTDYLENKLLDLTLKQIAYAPAGCFLALFTSNPTDTGGSGIEVSGGAYARQPITFAAAVSGTSSNTGVITYTAAGIVWGTISHFALFDTVSGGNMLYYAPLGTAKTIDVGDVVNFPVGSVTVSLD